MSTKKVAPRSSLSPDSRTVAQWMLATLEAKGTLYQEEAVDEIERQFGDEYIYDNENGNPAISRAVLKEFRKFTESTVVWDRYERCWRWREPRDPSGRQIE